MHGLLFLDAALILINQGFTYVLWNLICLCSKNELDFPVYLTPRSIQDW